MNAPSQKTYLEAINASCTRYPDLIKLNRFLSNPTSFPARAAVLEFRAGSVETTGFPDAESLQTYLSDSCKDLACKSRLYLLEDLTSPFVETFGSHFWMDPFLFAAQENSTHWTSSRFDHALPRRLPSLRKLDPSFTLRYYEVVKFRGKDTEKDKKTVSNVGRKIELGDLDHSVEGQQHPSSMNHVVRRNASFWSRARKHGGWDALILVDPAIGDSVLVNSSQIRRWPSKLYGYGYVDFTPWDVENACSFWQDTASGPPRESILDDIVWHWTKMASSEQIASVEKDSTRSSIFLKKIVASNLNVLLEFVWAKLSELERELGKFEGVELNYLAETLSNVNLFRRRLSWYYDEVEMNLRNLGISLEDGQDDEDGKELLNVLTRLQRYNEKIESLTPIVTGVLNVRQADISMRETRLVSKLTFVALVFIPLSFTASIFSMGGDFLPGNSLFWVYFAAALPITSIILGLTWWLRGKSFL